MATTSSTSSASSTASAASSIITALGAGSGVDMSALAEQLAQAQFSAKISQLSAKNDALTSKISTASSLKSQLLQLDSALGDRIRTGDLAPTPTITNASVAAVARSTTSAQAGNYSLEVFSLAKPQTLMGPAYAASTSTVGSGTLTLRFGNVSGGSFTADSGHSSVDIQIPSGATLADVARAINSSGAGVSAYVANAADGARLVLKGAEGAKSGFVLEATEASGDPGLSTLAWNPSTGDPSQLLATSADASFAIDGVAMTSSTNKVAAAAPGVSLTLTGTNAGNPATIGISDPSSAIGSFMTDFTSALNSIVQALNTATDPQNGDLARDDGARNLRRNLAALGSTVIMPNAAADAPKTLSELGLAIGRDGTFSFDAAKLQSQMANNPSGVAAMFTSGLYGVFGTVDKITRNATSIGVPGSLGVSLTTYTAQQKKLTDDTAKVADQQESVRARLASQLNAANVAISNSKSTQSYLQAQIAMWTKSGN